METHTGLFKFGDKVEIIEKGFYKGAKGHIIEVFGSGKRGFRYAILLMLDYGNINPDIIISFNEKNIKKAVI